MLMSILHVHVEPARGQRRDFARWCLAQTPQLHTASSTGTNVPVALYPSVPPELLAGAYVDGYLIPEVVPQSASPEPAEGSTAVPDADPAQSVSVTKAPRKRAARKTIPKEES
jgi:hypothetical protein